MEVVHRFQFGPLSQSVALVDCLEVERLFPTIFRGWTIERDHETDPLDCQLGLRRQAGSYHLDAPRLSSPIMRAEAADAICGLIAELFWAFVSQQNDLLCLHGAAVEVGDGLVIFPNRYRAGKSTLTACFAAAGFRVFADDVVPVGAPEDYAIAPGIAPRLRLPLPDDLSETTHRFFQSCASLSSRHYRYLDLPGDRLAPIGTQVRIGAFVLIERDPEAEPDLAPLGQGEVLRQAIWQNFARGGEAPDILERLHRIVTRAGCYRLRYRRAEEAVALLAAVFADGTASHPIGDAAAANGAESSQVESAFTSAKPSDRAIREIAVEGERFLADSRSGTIHHLNPLASAVWRLLESHTPPAEMVDLLRAAFPDVPPEKVRTDVSAILDSFASKGLIAGDVDGEATS